jgi:hypothetical protein
VRKRTAAKTWLSHLEFTVVLKRRRSEEPVERETRSKTMKTFTIALAAAASLVGAAFISTQASAAPGGFKPGIGKGGGGFKPGGFKPGGFKPGGFKPGMGGGAWKKPHPGYGHWGHGRGRGWGYAAAGVAGVATVAYFARPVYTSAYAECEWVRVRTEFGPRWRPYC